MIRNLPSSNPLFMRTFGHRSRTPHGVRELKLSLQIFSSINLLSHPTRGA